ncbi:MAG: O-antigen ligase family protein, partial [Acidobacteria bacterium]|nr:O-antigen ligase family protein [Acidobacteriota bacterium]
LMVLSAPHSIAATQISWLTGMFVWVIRLFIKPRPKLIKTPLDTALWAFFGWSVVSSVFSYAPDISIDRLRNVALFLIFYFVVNNLRNVRSVKFLASALIFSCMVNVLWTPIERIFGRGVEVSGVKTESPLAKALVIEGASITEGDTIIEVDKKKIRTPEDLIAELERKDISRVKFYRPDFNSIIEVRRADLLNGENAVEKLGIITWKHSRNWRSAGFYGHYTTYAEVLQLIASLTFGLFIAGLGRKREEGKIREELSTENKSVGAFFSPTFLPFSSTSLLLFCLTGMAFALLLTVTRASQLAFLVSVFAIVLANGSRKMLLTLAAIILPIVLVGLIFLQQSRKVGFFDTQDESTKWRQTVYREGFDLWTANPRHFFLGVGMDSIQRYAKEWRLFDNGRLPMGHFHSTPLQLVVERGLPALLLWLLILWIYARILLRNLKFQIPDSNNPQSSNWQTRGIILGGFGSLIGFFTSGLVHYNLGDAEVAMVFFMLMGLSISLCNFKFQIPN